MTDAPSITLVTGNNSALLSRALERVLGTIDRTVCSVVDISQEKSLTIPLQESDLLFEQQCFVVREPSASQLKEVIEYIKAPRDDARLVIVQGKALMPLRKAVTAAGGEIIESVSKTAQETLNKMFAESPLTFSGRAKHLIMDHVGEDVGTVPSLFDDMSALYDSGHVVQPDDVMPFLGKQGTIPIWGLLDAIDSGNTLQALELLGRIWSSTTAVALTTIITNHIERIFRLSTVGITDEKVAAEFLGMKGSTYPAKKAIQLGRRYKGASGPMLILAQKGAADVRGGSALPHRLILEILVGRLCTYPRR